MNTYIFLQLTRKDPPRLEKVVRAESVFEAIISAEMYPYDVVDFHEQRAEQQLPEMSEDEMHQEVFAYYGLLPNVDAYERGNDLSEYGNMIVEVSDDDDKEVKTYPTIGS
jgi:hypothetical protein